MLESDTSNTIVLAPVTFILLFRRARRYTYAGLSAGNSCFCADWVDFEATISSVGQHLNEDNCQMECSGDNKHACGGVQSLSIYDSKLLHYLSKISELKNIMYAC